MKTFFAGRIGRRMNHMQYALKEGLIMLRNDILLCHRFLYMKEKNKFTLLFDRDLYMLLLQHRARQH
jgi:hypothetical protein